MTAWWANYVGLPFRDGGRERSAIDCWGLCRLILSEQRGIDVPSYGGISAMDLAKVAATIGDAVHFDQIWNKVSAPREMDIAVMRQGRRGAHLGVMVDAENVLHSQEAANSCVVSITHPSVSFRLLGFYRHKDLM